MAYPYPYPYPDFPQAGNPYPQPHGYETQGNIRGNEDRLDAPMGLHEGLDHVRDDLQAPMQDLGEVPRGYGGYAGGNVRANQGWRPASRFVGTPGTFGGAGMGGYGGDARELRDASYRRGNVRDRQDWRSTDYGPYAQRRQTLEQPDRDYETERAGYRDDAFLGGSHPHDPHYRQWREQQLRSLDDDYRAWRDERYSRFSDEFTTWRNNRQQNTPR